MKIFTNVAALKLAKLTAGQLVETKGYYTAGDGGQARYLIVAPQAADEYGNHTLANSNVAVLQYEGAVNVKWFGAKGDGVADESTLIETILSTQTSVEFPDGVYKINSQITTPIESIIIKGLGVGAVLDCSGGGNISLESPLAALPTLSANIPKNGNTVTFVAAHGLSYGDVFCVWNADGQSWRPDPTTTNDFDGDWMRVAEVISPTQVKIYGSAPDAYLAADMECHKMTGGFVSVADITVKPNPAAFTDFRIVGHQGVRLSNLVAPLGGSSSGSISTIKCYDVVVSDLRGSNHVHPAYPISIVNSKKVRIQGSSTYSTRHCITLGGTVGAGSVPTRSVVISDSILTNYKDSNIGAADIHGNCDDITYTNCTMDAGANPGGRNVRFNNCRIMGRPLDENAMYASALNGGTHIFSDCIIETDGTGGTFGVFGFDASYMREDWRLILNDCVIVAPGKTISNIVRVNFTDDWVPNRVDVEINNITIQATAVSAVYRPNHTVAIDITPYTSFSLSGYKAPSTTRYFSTATPALTRSDMPVKLPTQYIEHVFNTDPADAVNLYLSPAQSYTIYPKQPRLALSYQNATTSVMNVPGGADFYMLSPLDVLANASRFHLYTANGANFALTRDIRVTGTVWLDELS